MKNEMKELTGYEAEAGENTIPDETEAEAVYPEEMRPAGTEGDAPAAQMVDIQRKILRAERVRTAIILLIAVPALVFGFFTGMSVKNVEQKMDSMAKQMAGMTDSMEYMTGLITSLNTLSARLIGEVEPGAVSDTLEGMKEALTAISDAAGTIAALDPDAVNALLVRLDEELTGVSDVLDTVKQLDPDAVNNLLGRLDEIMDTLNRLTPVLETVSKWRIFG